MGKDSINILSNPGKGYVKTGANAPFFYRVQSSKFRVQMMCRIRDKFYLLDCHAICVNKYEDTHRAHKRPSDTTTKKRLPRHLRWLAMTRVWLVLALILSSRGSIATVAIQCVKMRLFLELSDHPAAARHPSNGGELGTVLYFFTYSAATPVESLGGELIFPTVGGGAIHDTVHCVSTSLPMRCRTIVPIRIQGLILCRFHTLIISLGLCVTSLPHRFV